MEIKSSFLYRFAVYRHRLCTSRSKFVARYSEKKNDLELCNPHDASHMSNARSHCAYVFALGQCK